MSTITIVDTETTGFSPKTDSLIEIAWATWSITHGQIIDAHSRLIKADSNAAEPVNRIAPALLQDHGGDAAEAIGQFCAAVKPASAIVAHNAQFDRAWLGHATGDVPWVCSWQDVKWPRASRQKSLTALALAHGVGVVTEHRALADVMTLAAVFSRVHEMGHDVAAMLAHAMRKKTTFVVSDRTYDPARNAVAKENGFAWDAGTRVWSRTMTTEDASTLPFDVTMVAGE